MNSTVSDKGQVTLPKAIRDALGIQPGTQLRFDIQPDKSLRVVVRTRGAQGLRGLIARPGERVRSLEEMDDGIAAAVIERSKRR